MTGPDESTQERQRGLDQEQSVLDLEQTAGELEQLANDDRQAGIDADQTAVDGHRHDELCDEMAFRLLGARQSILDRTQFRLDIRQAACDLLQTGRDDQQEALDDARRLLYHPVTDGSSDGRWLELDANERMLAAVDRGEAGLARAEATRARVERRTTWSVRGLAGVVGCAAG